METQEDITILDFPRHILEKIVNFVPRKDRLNVSLTCSFFYAIVCNVEKFQRRMKITDNNVSDDSILWSKRKFNEISINFRDADCQKFLLATEILMIHGGAIEKMQFEANGVFINPTISAYQYVNFFKQVPKLKFLKLNGSPWQFSRLYNIEPVLKHLEVLDLCTRRIGEGGQEIAEIYKPNTISKLIIERNWENLEKFMQMQRNIKHLTVGNVAVRDYNHFANLRLESLAFNEIFSTEFGDIEDEEALSEAQDCVHQLIVQHPELKSIRFRENDSSLAIRLQTFNFVCTMENLERLDLAVDENILAELNQLSNLPNIKKIVFDLNSLEDLEALIIISSIPLPTLEKVKFQDFQHRHFNNSLIIDNISMNWRHLKELSLDNASDNGIDFLNEFLDKLSQLEILEIGEKSSMLHPRDFTFHDNQQQYLCLKKLVIQGSAAINTLGNLLECLPNLESFVFASEIRYGPQILQNLLKHAKLKELDIKLSFGSRLIHGTHHDIQLLLQLCRRLKQFWIVFKEQRFSEQLLSSIEAYIRDRQGSLVLRK